MVRSIHLGMGEVGEERLKIYSAAAAKRGQSFSAFIVGLVDKDLDLDLHKAKPRKVARPSTKK